MTVEVGSILSFSAGNPENDRLSCRVVDSAADKIMQVVSKNSTLEGVIAERLPLIVGCYPAFLGFFPSAVFVDTYLRPSVFERALRLAANEDWAPVLVSQPLIIADLLQRCAAAVRLHTKPLIVAMGGYACPWGLEKFLMSLLPQGSVILHGYGMAEVGFACLLGTRQHSGEVAYRLVDPDVEVSLQGGLLGFSKTLYTERQHWNTEDRARLENGLYFIQPGEKRVSPRVWNELQSWSPAQWSRRTGHFADRDGRLSFQLRSGEAPQSGQEIDFYDFARDHGMTWFDKPTWSI